MKKIATYLILLIAVSASSTTIYGQGYGQGYGQNNGRYDDVYNDPYYQPNNAPAYNTPHPNNGGYYQSQPPAPVVINARPIIVNPYAVHACAPPVSYCRPVVINPYPVYPIARRGYMAHNRRRGFYHGRGWR